MDFKSFQLHPHIESGIKALGYTQPTPIQTQCIPPILNKRDVMGLAQTGTGKTAAFVLPILQNLMDGPRKHIRTLIIAPTRELAEQIHESVRQLGRQTKIKSTTVYGGVNKVPQIEKLRKGAEIVVACPGRLIDLMEQGMVDLSRVEVFVMDEADRMFDMGFLPDVRKIVKQLPDQRQTLMFSATMPDDIQDLAREILSDPVTVRVADTVPIASVSHAIYPVESHLKTALLMKILAHTDTDSVLVFTRTKHGATRLANHMKTAGLIAASLQGDLPQSKRQETLNGFRNGKYRILVATDIAARGIDVSRISHVINYDMPDTVDAYTHRIGRTGRAERTGDAYTFVTLKDRAFVWTIEKALGETIEKRTLGDFNYNVPAPAGSSSLDRLRRSARSNDSMGHMPGSMAQRTLPVSQMSQTAPSVRNGSKRLASKKLIFSSSRFKSKKSR